MHQSSAVCCWTLHPGSSLLCSVHRGLSPTDCITQAPFQAWPVAGPGGRQEGRREREDGVWVSPPIFLSGSISSVASAPSSKTLLLAVPPCPSGPGVAAACPLLFVSRNPQCPLFRASALSSSLTNCLPILKSLCLKGLESFPYYCCLVCYWCLLPLLILHSTQTEAELTGHRCAYSF